MKNASQIITSIQYKPQYHRILEHKCVSKLISSLLPTIRNNIKFGFIKNNKLHFIISATLNKYDKDNIINTIKMILKSPMILESKSFFECLDVNIKDVVIYTDHKPKINFEPFSTNSQNITYQERSSGNFEINIDDEKLNSLVRSIQEIIKKANKNES